MISGTYQFFMTIICNCSSWSTESFVLLIEVKHRLFRVHKFLKSWQDMPTSQRERVYATPTGYTQPHLFGKQPGAGFWPVMNKDG